MPKCKAGDTHVYPCDTVVQKLNNYASITAFAQGLPTVDLHKEVTDICGTRYVNCSICRMEPCSYHYTPAGYTILAKKVASAMRNLLSQ